MHNWMRISNKAQRQNLLSAVIHLPDVWTELWQRWPQTDCTAQDNITAITNLCSHPDAFLHPTPLVQQLWRDLPENVRAQFIFTNLGNPEWYQTSTRHQIPWVLSNKFTLDYAFNKIWGHPYLTTTQKRQHWQKVWDANPAEHESWQKHNRRMHLHLFSSNSQKRHQLVEAIITQPWFNWTELMAQIHLSPLNVLSYQNHNPKLFGWPHLLALRSTSNDWKNITDAYLSASPKIRRQMLASLFQQGPKPKPTVAKTKRTSTSYDIWRGYAFAFITNQGGQKITLEQQLKSNERWRQFLYGPAITETTQLIGSEDEFNRWADDYSAYQLSMRTL